VLLVVDLHELQVDAYVLSFPGGGSLDHGIHVQLAGDFLNAGSAPSVHLDRVKTHDLRITQSPECRDQFIGHRVSEVTLVSVRAEILEREDRQPADT